ncbi:recQ-mediated genome instability protein 1 [Pseudophryne corroboree]|uniref:recQ-mediated genome instability protein 1 n=1 Tax=Pseudophryne corroboree TaxID=495146 RepID=UPI003081B0E7
MNTYAVRVKTWLFSTWHVKVPDPWLEACINWIQEENGGGSLSLAEINKQVFEQWLLTDLRDLEHTVLPAGVLESLKFELNGYYALQLDSLVDVSQPAYSQLQSLRGRGNGNDQVTATTQASQPSWESKPSRMLMLQLTDGTQNIQGMEYQSVPALHSGLSPGTKILLQGIISCRLGVLLLKPENIKVLGGEVEALVEEYAQDKVLSRLIGMEENPMPLRTAVQGQVTGRPQDAIHQALGLSDDDLLASLDENDELTVNNDTVPESGYCSRNDHSSSNSSISYLDQPQAQVSRNRQDRFLTSNEPAQVYVRNNLEDVYDLDDDLFLEEEIQRELEEMSMDQAEITNRNQNSSTGILASTAITSHNFSTSLTSTDNFFSDDLSSPPFTYLSAVFSNKSDTIKYVKLKSFIVTLNGNLTSSSGFWCIKAKISDGTGYMDVEFSNDVLTKLIGFSVPEMKILKRDPSQQNKLMTGLQKCQRELTDFCGLMSISYNLKTSEASVLALQDVNEETRLCLSRRLNM